MAASISEVRLIEESEWSRPDWCMSISELLVISAGCQNIDLSDRL